MQKLGLDTLVNSGIASVSDIMTNLDDVIKKLETSSPSNYSKLVATTHILSDILVKADTTTLNVAQIATASQNLAAKIVSVYSNYPSDGSGSDIVVNLKKDTNYDLSSVTESVLTDLTAITQPTTQESKPVTDSNKPTGTGTGAGTDGPGTSGN